MTISFPDNAKARKSVRRYIAVLAQTFARAFETTSAWVDAFADQADSSELYDLTA
jgi:mycolipenoyl-CoA---2-(long-chain-fatty acyl)-trehalose mycolipenoyltransferase / long-chain-acyl-CoA---trehalose acyltransferase